MALNKMIKINLPADYKDFDSGNGEGVLVEIDERTNRDYERDKDGGRYYGMMKVSSIYYPFLKCGNVIPFEMRGKKIPVADYEFLVKVKSAYKFERDIILESGLKYVSNEEEAMEHYVR